MIILYWIFSQFFSIIIAYKINQIDGDFHIYFFEENGSYSLNINSKPFLWVQFQSIVNPMESLWLKIKRNNLSSYPVLVKSLTKEPYYLPRTSRLADCHWVAMSHLMNNTPSFTESLTIDPLESNVDGEHLPISLCSDGLSGIASLQDGHHLVRIESRGRRGQSDLVHLLQFHKLPSHNVGELNRYSNLIDVAGQKLLRSKRSIRASAVNRPGPFVVELYLIVDSKMVSMYGGNSYTELLSRIRNILNQINIAFMEFNIYFVVTQLEIWEEDQIKLTDENHILMELQLYKRRFIDKKHDCLHAILGENLGSAKRGQSERASMCAYNRCVGYTKNHRDLEELNIAHHVIHELGHNFGLTHDTEACKCFGCIMSTGVEFGIRKFQWSVCSRKEISSLLKSGMADCLRDEPLAQYGTFQASILSRNNDQKPRIEISMSLCGNGVVDDGEECDCGGSIKCSVAARRCCNPNTCRLRLGAYCAGGACCDIGRCKMKQPGTVCRSIDNRNCDLPEYCDGVTEWCPSDVYKHDGVPCTTFETGQSSHCYRGQCHSRQSWCRVLYGESAYEGDSSCFTLNNIGDKIKNCGVIVPGKEERDRQPIFWEPLPCSKENEMCGRLWCSHSNERLMRSSPQIESEEIVNGGQCSAVRFYLDWFLDDSGMVPNGSPCGHGKMCWQGACVSSWLNSVVGCDCHGHGVCNNRRHCHCDAGFAPPNCTEFGNGGSIDSGSPQTFSRRSSIIVAGIVIGVIIVLAVLVISVLLYHFRTRKWPIFLKWIKWPEYQKPEFIIESKEPNKFGRSDSRYIRCSISQFEKPPTSPRSPTHMIFVEPIYSDISISGKTSSEISPRTKNNTQWQSLLKPKSIILERISENKPMQFENPKLVPPKPLTEKPTKPAPVQKKPAILSEKPEKVSNIAQNQTQLSKPPLLCSKPNKSTVNDETINVVDKSKKPPPLYEKPVSKSSNVTSQEPQKVTDYSVEQGQPFNTQLYDLNKSRNPQQPLLHKGKISKMNISQPQLEETTCNALTRELSSPDQTLSRFVGSHKIIKVDANTAIKYLY